MADDLFIVVFDADVPPDVMDRAESLSDGRVHRLADNVLLVNFPNSTSRSLVRKLWPSYDLDDDPPAMVAFELNGSYSGYYYKRLWTWLDETVEQTVSV